MAGEMGVGEGMGVDGSDGGAKRARGMALAYFLPILGSPKSAADKPDILLASLLPALL